MLVLCSSEHSNCTDEKIPDVSRLSHLTENVLGCRIDEEVEHSVDTLDHVGRDSLLGQHVVVDILVIHVFNREVTQIIDAKTTEQKSVNSRVTTDDELLVRELDDYIRSPLLNTSVLVKDLVVYVAVLEHVSQSVPVAQHVRYWDDIAHDSYLSVLYHRVHLYSSDVLDEVHEGSVERLVVSLDVPC